MPNDEFLMTNGGPGKGQRPKGKGQNGAGQDQLKDRIEELIGDAGKRQEFVTARELAGICQVEARDVLRAVKVRIEALKDEGCPIVGLPETPGPGYTWIHDPTTDWARDVMRRHRDDMGSRVKKMVRHLASIQRVALAVAQQELFRAGQTAE